MLLMPATTLRELLSPIIDIIEPACCRLGIFFAMSILDDPAMLAVAFC